MADRTPVAWSLLSLAETQRWCTGLTTPTPTGAFLDDLCDTIDGITDELERFWGKARGRRRVVTRLTGEAPSPITEYHTAVCDNPGLLTLGQFPIIAITSVKEGYWDTTGLWVATSTLTVNVDYRIESATEGTLRRLWAGAMSTWATGDEAIQVIYTGGYANTAAVPAHIKRHAGKYAARAWGERKNPGAQSISDAQGTITRFMPAELLRIEAAALDSESRYFTTGREA